MAREHFKLISRVKVYMQSDTLFQVGMSALPFFYFKFSILSLFLAVVDNYYFFLCTAGLEQTVVCTCSLWPGEGATVCSPGPNRSCAGF